MSTIRDSCSRDAKRAVVMFGDGGCGDGKSESGCGEGGVGCSEGCGVGVEDVREVRMVSMRTRLRLRFRWRRIV